MKSDEIHFEIHFARNTKITCWTGNSGLETEIMGTSNHLRITHKVWILYLCLSAYTFWGRWLAENYRVYALVQNVGPKNNFPQGVCNWVHTPILTIFSSSIHHVFFGFQVSSPTAGESNVEKKPSLDTSLKLITATIQGMKHWNQYKDKTHLMFEIIGMKKLLILNSANSDRRKMLIISHTFIII